MLGRRGLFVTLTYDRSKFDTPRELYDRQKEERHVRRFIERLETRTGLDLTGKWCRKMEFQKGDWVHFHLVIDVPWIPKKLIDECWSWGFTWVNATRPNRLKYFCKYTAKTGEFPTFLLAERARSVRIVSASPGFWLDSETARHEVSKGVLPYYSTVGSILLNRTDSIVVRCPDRWMRIDVSIFEALSFSRATGTDGKWYLVNEVPAGLPAGTLHLTQSPDPPEWCMDYAIGEGHIG